jgi:hypothetical protein
MYVDIFVNDDKIYVYKIENKSAEKKGCPGRTGDRTRDILISFIISFHHFTAEPQQARPFCYWKYFSSCVNELGKVGLRSNLVLRLISSS